MSSSNDRGQYGTAPRVEPSRLPWILGGVGLAAIGLVLISTHTVKRPRLSVHEKEVHAWEAEFPGLPWYMDQVKDSRQLDMWERARDHWERTH